ncbi:hypothetical protein GCM10027020_09540 [Nocardioides salsibiostraticola]
MDPGAGGFEEAAPVEVRAQRTSKPAPRTVVLHVHLTDAAIRGEDNVARCANTRTPILGSISGQRRPGSICSAISAEPND